MSKNIDPESIEDLTQAIISAVEDAGFEESITDEVYVAVCALATRIARVHGSDEDDFTGDEEPYGDMDEFSSEEER